MAVPPPIVVQALVDTGASSTCLDLNSLAPLGLAQRGTTLIHTPSTGATPVEAPLYDVRLVLLHVEKKSFCQFDAVPVIGASLAEQGIQGLIGRDILSECLFIYDGPSATFTLAF